MNTPEYGTKGKISFHEKTEIMIFQINLYFISRSGFSCFAPGKIELSVVKKNFFNDVILIGEHHH